jgi:hypothetical protein
VQSERRACGATARIVAADVNDAHAD